jgi:hypothetical protein
MSVRLFVSTIAVGVACSTLVGAGSPGAQATQKPTVAIPNPGVAQIMTLEDRFVRVAYNNEGYVTMGYRLANGLQGKDWIMLEVGMALREGVQAQKLPRTAVSLSTPTGDLPLPTQTEFSQVDLRNLDQQAKVINDAINYFPPNVRGACRIGFFSEIGSGTPSFNEVELSDNRGCLGRLYFKIPGGLKQGQHFLNVQFKNSKVRVPFRILTKEEEQQLNKSWKDIKKQVDEAFKKGGK